MLNALQWPAMLVTILASWLVASKAKRRRFVGFWVFLLSNVLWIAWGVADSAYALVVLQAVLMVTNVRGIIKSREADRTSPSDAG